MMITYPFHAFRRFFYVMFMSKWKLMWSTQSAFILIYIEKTSSIHIWGMLLSAHAAWCHFNTLRPRQNGRHFPDNTFKCIFFNENVWISIKISLKFVPKGSINNIPALVQIMAWRRLGAKPLSEPMVACSPTHICVSRPQWVKCIILIRRSRCMGRNVINSEAIHSFFHHKTDRQLHPMFLVTRIVCFI